MARVVAVVSVVVLVGVGIWVWRSGDGDGGSATSKSPSPSPSTITVASTSTTTSTTTSTSTTSVNVNANVRAGVNVNAQTIVNANGDEKTKTAGGGAVLLADISAPSRKTATSTVENNNTAIALVGSSSITGVVKFRGKPPERARLRMVIDPYCAKFAVDDEEVMVGANGGLENVVVRVLGAPSSPAPATVASLSQEQCQYRPRVQAIVAGQPLEIRNTDRTLHNVHTYREHSTLFNQAQVPNSPAIEKRIAPPGLLKIKCDVHPWMTGYVSVHENALFAVTGADGAFTIAGVPPGRYTIEAWHERYGAKRAEIVVGAAPAVAAFEFSDTDGTLR